MSWFNDLFKGVGKVASTAAPFVGMANPALGVGLAAGGQLAQGRNIGQAVKSGIGQGFSNFFGGTPAYAASITNPSVAGVKTNFLSPTQLASQNAGRFASQSPSSGGLGNILKMFGATGGDQAKNIGGIASLATGLLKGYPKVPDTSAQLDQLRAQAGGNPLSQFAQGQLQNQMNEQYNPLTQPEIDAALRQIEVEQGHAVDQLRDQYRNLRPGTDPSTDSTFRRDLMELQDQFSRQKADTLATRTRDTKSIFDQQRMQQIQMSLNASNQEMQNLTEIAKMEISQIMEQLNLDYNQASLFKETFIGIGQGLLAGPQQSSGQTFNINTGV